ncbi:MAG: class I poly(R)-hydroxyalkanoic acid synthase, partial [Pseudomonadota bacterium]|nr:class I poly(R)-hydroxyalkanoic acid synthase [Pseudomonadota bacterium]
MNQQIKEPLTTPELNRLFTTLQNIFFKSQKLAILYGNPFYNPQNALTQFELDPLNLNRPIQELFWHWLMQPQKLWESQIDLWQQQVKLIQNNMLRLMGYSLPPLITEDKGDRRFQHHAWQTPGFDWIKQSYLLTARWLETLMNDLPLETLNHQDIEKLKFYTQQLIDAASPSNFVFTNPEVLYATLKSSGENLLKGLEHFLTDIYRGHGQLSIKMTDFDAFELGKNIAATPGKVIYQNELMQLIHYQPTTSEVHSIPLLIVPPWINKYYILDLQSHNSFVKWVIDQGHSVFLISWVNPDKHLADKTFEDYLLQGPLTALDVVKEVTEQSQVNTVGYCLGGTLLAITLAYLAAQQQQQQIASATFFTTLLDFSHPGELGIFIDEQQIEALERRMSAQGYLEANAMATTFSLLRANDLIWSFYVNNYLLGKTPPPFDLLYWN